MNNSEEPRFLFHGRARCVKKLLLPATRLFGVGIYWRECGLMSCFLSTRSRLFAVFLGLTMVFLTSCNTSTPTEEAAVQAGPTDSDAQSASSAVNEAELLEIHTDYDAIPLTREYTLLHLAPFYTTPYSPQSRIGVQDVLFFGEPGSQYKLVDRQKEWLLVEPPGEVPVWTPIWYGLEKAKASEHTVPALVALKKDFVLSLFPNSTLQWHSQQLDSTLQQSIASGDVFTVRRWEEWLEVIIPHAGADAESNGRKPVQLWISEQEVESIKTLDQGMLRTESALDTGTLYQVLKAALSKGLAASEAEKLLGKSNVIETSRSLNSTGEPLRLGTDWRYERDEDVFVAVLDENDHLLEGRWILPRDEHTTQAAYDYSSIIQTEYWPHEFVKSQQPNWVWRNEGTLAYSYLLAATDEILLLRGDDGGYSGMHYDSSLYAVDRQTGKTLWQVDARFGGASALIDPDQKHVTVLTHIDPQLGGYKPHLRKMQLRDGKIIWEQRFDEKDGGRMTTAKGVVALYSEPFEETPGKLTVYDNANGKQKWERLYKESYELLNRNASDPYLLVMLESAIQALDPETGKKVWEVKSDHNLFEWDSRSSGYFLESPIDRLKPPPSSRWFRFRNDQVLIDLKSGKVLAKYIGKTEEAVHAIHHSSWLIMKALDHPLHYEATQFETSLYNPMTGKKLWTIPGRITYGAIDGEHMYIIHDGLPATVSLKDGKIIWKAKGQGEQMQMIGSSITVISDDLLLYNSGSSFYILRKSDRKLLYRWKDVLTGYIDGRDDMEIRSGFINSDGEYIYLGSANGYYSKVKLP